MWSRTISMFADHQIQFLWPLSLVMVRAAFSIADSDMGALGMVFFRAGSRTAGLAKSELFPVF